MLERLLEQSEVTGSVSRSCFLRKARKTVTLRAVNVGREGLLCSQQIKLPFKVRTHGGENLPNNLVLWQIIRFWNANLKARGTFLLLFTGLRARAYCQKGTQICDLLANKCPQGHNSVSKTRDIYLTRGHLFDSEGHSFEMEGHLFDKKEHLF